MVDWRPLFEAFVFNFLVVVTTDIFFVQPASGERHVHHRGTEFTEVKNI